MIQKSNPTKKCDRNQFCQKVITDISSDTIRNQFIKIIITHHIGVDTLIRVYQQT